MARHTQARGTTYAGARGRWTLPDLSRAGRRYACQPKVDGCLATVLLDSRGCIAHVLSRTGAPFGPGVLSDLVGVKAGLPWSVLVGELEAFTEASRRAVEGRGYPVIWLHDAHRIGDDLVERLPYHARRDALGCMLGELQDADVDRPWVSDAQGKAHSPRTGVYVEARPRSWRRVPLVPQVPAHQAEQLWAEHVDQQGGEGVVAVALDAPMGRRGSKRKIRAHYPLDAVVVEVGRDVLVCSWTAAGKVFAVGRCGAMVRAGDVVEVRSDGVYDSGLPKHPRLIRVRQDLAPVGAA